MNTPFEVRVRRSSGQLAKVLDAADAAEHEDDVGTRALAAVTREVEAYAPPTDRGRFEHYRDETVQVIEAFAELPTEAIDEEIKKAQAAISLLLNEAAEIRANYMRRTEALRRKFLLHAKASELARDMLARLNEDMVKLHDEPPAEAPPKVTE